MRLPDESIEELNSEATAWRLLAPWGVTPENARLERHTVYRFQARWVDGWRKGRLLLAGDAAHQMPPFAGQGMCSGLRDAANVAWKLDLVLRGDAPASLLDTYEAERVQHVRLAIGASMDLGKVICIADPAEAAARDQAMIAAAASGHRITMPAGMPIGPGITRDGDANAGQLFVQGHVRRGGVSGLFDDVVGRGWTLIAATGDPRAHLDATTAAFFTSLGGIAAHIGAGGFEDVDGVYGRWFAENGAGVVLQRPDFYLFGSAIREEDAGLLVRDLQRVLA